MEDDAANLALAIALSRQQQRDEEAQRSTSTPGRQGNALRSLYEVQCCGSLFFALTPLVGCPSCASLVPSSDETSRPKPTQTRHDSQVGPPAARSVVIKPTRGSFRQYSNKMLLHCGITSTAGRVYNFDEKGLHIDWDWHECISIPIAAAHLSDLQWDEELERHQAAEITLKPYRSYHQLQNNCYDFVIRFLNGIKFEGRDNHQKEDIVARFIQTPVDLFESYYALWKKLNSREGLRQGFIKLSGVTGQPSHLCDACTRMIFAKETRYRCTECQDFDLCADCKEKEVGKHKASHRMLAMYKRRTDYPHPVRCVDSLCSTSRDGPILL